MAKVKRSTKQVAYVATGRRKNAIARVRLIPGKGLILVNRKSFEQYFGRGVWEVAVRAPLDVTKTVGRFDVLAHAHGGGITGQAGAVRHGIARALVNFDPELRPILRKAGLLTRDPRMKERKKYGRKRARKRFQWTKR